MATFPPMPLAAPAPGPGDPADLLGDVLPWLIVLIVLVVIGGFVIAIARRYTRGQDTSAGGFTLHDLRQLHAAGELTDEQFQRAKARMIGRVAADVREPPREGDQEGDSGGDNPAGQPPQP